MAKKITKTFILERDYSLSVSYHLRYANGRSMFWLCTRPLARYFPNCKLKPGEKRKVKITMELLK